MMEQEPPSLSRDGGARAQRHYEPPPLLKPDPPTDYRALYNHARFEIEKSWGLAKDSENSLHLERCMNQDLWNMLTIDYTGGGGPQEEEGAKRAGQSGGRGLVQEEEGEGEEGDAEVDGEAPERPDVERYLRWLQRRSERLVLENTRIYDKLDCVEIAKSKLAEKLRLTEQELDHVKESRAHLAQQLEQRTEASERDWAHEVERAQEAEKERELHAVRQTELMGAKSRIKALEREVRVREERVEQFERLCSYFRSQLVLMPFVNPRDEKMMQLLKLESDRRAEKADRFMQKNIFAARRVLPQKAVKGCVKAANGGEADEQETAMEIDRMAKGVWKEKRTGPPPMGPPQQPPPTKRTKAEYVVDATASEPFKKPLLPGLPPPNKPAKKLAKKKADDGDGGGVEADRAVAARAATTTTVAKKKRNIEEELRKKAHVALVLGDVAGDLGITKEGDAWRKAAREAMAAKEQEEREERAQKAAAKAKAKREATPASQSQVVPDGDVDLFSAGESGVMIYETDEDDGDEQGRQASDTANSDDQSG